MPDLDPEQAAVAAWRPGDGDLRVDAPAGAGKTTSVTALCAALLNQRVIPPNRLVATTFANRAAREIAGRLEQQASVYAPYARIGTFHGLAYRFLRRLDDSKWAMSACLDANGQSRGGANMPSTSVVWRSVVEYGTIPGLDKPSLRIAKRPEEVRAYGAFADLLRARGIESVTDAPAAMMRLAPEDFEEAWDLFRASKAVMHGWDWADALAVYLAHLRNGEDSADVVVVDECLPGITPILLADKTTRTIKDIVESGDRVDVLSYDTAMHTQVVRSVVGRKVVPLQKRLVRIKAHRSDAPRGFIGRAWVGRRILVCTEDHQIYCNGGWVAAGQIKAGDVLQGETGAPIVDAYNDRVKIGQAGRRKIAASVATRQDQIQCAFDARRARGEVFGGPLGSTHAPRGGNGRALTEPQVRLLAALGAGWVAEHAVTTGYALREEFSAPKHYKLDLANPSCMLAVEIDGESHRAPARKEQDRRKDALLQRLGWRVIRVSNLDAAQKTEAIAAMIMGEPQCPIDLIVDVVEEFHMKDYFVYDLEVEDTHTYYANGVLVHNCQDNSPIQHEIASVLAKNGNGRRVIVGDWSQCIPAGQRVNTPRGLVLVEHVHAGMVIHGAQGGEAVNVDVDAVTTSQHTHLLEFTTETGRVFQTTRNHVIFAALGDTPEGSYVYLMYRPGWGYRIGSTQQSGKKGDKLGFGYHMRSRSQQEGAERVWFLAYCEDAAAAIRLEHTLAYRYGIPMDPFVNRKGGKFTEVAGAQAYFNEFEPRGETILAAYGLSFAYPTYMAKATARDRVAINVLLGSVKSDFEVAVESQNIPDEAKRAFPFVATRRDCWRLRRTFRTLPIAMHYANTLAQACGGYVVQALSLPESDRRVFAVTAAGVHPGMVIPTITEAGSPTLETVSTRREITLNTPVTCYDLSVPATGSFYVNGVVVHNCVHEWRGADPSAFAKFAGKTISLVRNYRSVPGIVELSNAITQGQTWKIGPPSVPVRPAIAVTATTPAPAAVRGLFTPEIEEAVVDEIAALIRNRHWQGHEIAILTRTNAQLVAFQGMLVANDIPSIVYGQTSLFESMECEAVLAYAYLSQHDGYGAIRRAQQLPRRFLPRDFADQCKACPGPFLQRLRAVAGMLPDGSKRGALALANDLQRLRGAPWANVPTIIAEIITPPPEKIKKLRVGESPDEDRPGLLAAMVKILRRFPTAMEAVRFVDKCRRISQAVGDEANRPAGKVILSTAHRFKGQEARRVYVYVETGTFPHKKAGLSEMAAEHRLFYVACTRARDDLVLAFKAQPSEFAIRFCGRELKEAGWSGK